MSHVKIKAFDCPDAWYKTLATIWKEGDTFEVRYGSECSVTKKLNLTIEVLHPENRPLIGDGAPCDMKYVQWYALKYLWSGDIDDESYTYGSRLRKPVDQIEELIRRYLDEQNDRQVTLVVRLPEDIRKEIRGSKHEPPCLSIIDTEIYSGKMHMTCYFRSWDAYAGLPANIAGLQLLNEAMVSEIRERGKSKLQTGKMILHSKNCHIYERQFRIVQSLLEPKRKRRHKLLDMDERKESTTARASP